VTEPAPRSHPGDVPAVATACLDAPADSAPAALRFERVYAEHFDFVWRTARRLGVPERSVDDAVQDVFIVVHRRLGEFEGRSSVKTWLFGIARRVAADHRRRGARKDRGSELTETVADVVAPTPLEAAANAEAVRMLHRVLAGLSDEQREVFVLAELEQMSAPEIAEAIGAKLNTVYSRLRLARAAFNRAVARATEGQPR